MEPLEIHIPLSVREEQIIGIKIEEANTISLKVDEHSGGIYPIYEGETVITPKVHESTTLDTSRKVVMDDIVIEEIPYYETSNVKGITFIVGGN